MTIVNILRDGSIQPPLKQEHLMVQLLNGNLRIGRYEKDLYINEFDNYITEPSNAVELKKELLKFISVSMPELFSKHYVVHFICPSSISAKVKWATQPVLS